MRNKAASLALAAGISVGSLSGCSAINEKLSGAPGDVKLEHVVDAKISDTQYESIDAAARNAAMVVLKKSVEQEGNAPRRMFSFAEQTGQIELHNTQGILDIGTDDSGEPIVELQIGNTENGITSS
ncbi:hypothetical protein KDA23_02120, partial [Candidatus Saccharibacteria bacterium]|nr:hypothetical protein [Candidatus Saccharibacteria bacterium]